MLILSRRAGEAVRIFENVEIEILEIKGNQVRIGFSAPYSIPIYREEIYQKIKKGTDKGNKVYAHKHHQE